MWRGLGVSGALLVHRTQVALSGLTLSKPFVWSSRGSLRAQVRQYAGIAGAPGLTFEGFRAADSGAGYSDHVSFYRRLLACPM